MEKTLEQLINLKDYCMENVRGKADTWYDDAEALEVAINALNKQMPKKPTEHTKLPNDRFAYLCPTCNRMYWDREFLSDYCSSCGQKIRFRLVRITSK